MKRYAALVGVTLILWMATACNETADTHDADVKAIRNVESQWNQDFASKDADKLVAHYANYAVMMTPGMAASSGKDAIRTAITQMLSDPALSLQFHAAKVDVAKSGDLAYTQGSYTMTTTDPQTKKVRNDHGSYVTVYRKQIDESWKAVSYIATSEAPPATVQADKMVAQKHVQKHAQKHVKKTPVKKRHR
jgi:uncharacterized protein (TIGR02246 family)